MKPKYRKIDALIGINNLTSVQQPAYSNHLQFFYNLGKSFHKSQHMFANPPRMSIDNFRNFCASVIEAMPNIEYLFFVDDDVLIPGDAFKRLRAANKDIVAGVTLIRGYPYHPMIFDFSDKKNHYIDDYEKKADKKTGLLKCDAVGFSCCLIKGDLIRKFGKLKQPDYPFFATGKGFTEDVFFCRNVTSLIPDAQIYVDTKVITSHILGSATIEPASKKAQIKYDETVDPTLRQRSRDFERSQKREAAKQAATSPQHDRTDFERTVKLRAKLRTQLSNKRTRNR